MYHAQMFFAEFDEYILAGVLIDDGRAKQGAPFCRD